MRKNIRSVYTQFSASSAPILKVMSRIQGETAAALKDKSLLEQHHTMQHGSVVLLSGFLESFLRSVCEVFFTELRAKGVGLKALGPDYLSTHLREGAGHLSDLIKREGKKKSLTFSDSTAFAKRFVAPFSDDLKSPVWEAFARTKGNPSSSVVTAVLDGLGITGGFNSLSTAINGKYSANTMVQLLNNLIELRNESAHTGKTTNVPQPSDITEIVLFCRYLALAVCRLADKKVSVLTVVTV